MSERAPLTPPDCDLTDFKFMPLLVVRLRDSDLASEQTPEENWAAVLLWAASWHQVPAASLPDVDATIAKWAGYMMRGKIDARWREIRAGAMRGFVLCSDGRWYHPVVAEVAREAWTGKLRQRLKTECSRIKKHNERHGTRIPFPDFETWLADGCPVGHALPVPSDKNTVSPGQPPSVTGETASKGQGQGQGQGQGSSELPPPPPPESTTPPPAPAEESARPPSPPEDQDREDEARNRDGPPNRVTRATAAVVALRAEGIGRANGGDPRLLALLDRGAELQHFASAGREAIERKARDPFAYALGVVEGQLTAAQAMAAGAKAKVPPPPMRKAEAQAALIGALTGRTNQPERTDHAAGSTSAIDVESRVLD